MNHQTLVAMQRIARQDILRIDENDNEDQTSIKYQLTSPVISTQLLSDSLHERTGYTNEYKENSEQFSVSKSREDTQNADDYKGTASEGSAVSSPGFLDRLKEFLDPKPMLVAKRKHDYKDISYHSENTENAMQSENSGNDRLFHGKESHAEGKGNLERPMDSINVPGHHLWPTDNDGCTCVDEDKSDRELHSSITASISDGSLADVSSLASDQPHSECKRRSSRRRMKKKNDNQDEALSSDESEAEQEEIKSIRSNNKSAMQAKGNLETSDIPNLETSDIPISNNGM